MNQNQQAQINEFFSKSKTYYAAVIALQDAGLTDEAVKQYTQKAHMAMVNAAVTCRKLGIDGNTIAEYRAKAATAVGFTGVDNDAA